VDDLEREILDNRARLIAAEALLDRKVRDFVKQLAARWVAEIKREARSSSASTVAELDRRLVALRRTLDAITESQFQALQASLRTTAKQVFVSETYRHAAILDTAVVSARGSVGAVFGGVSPKALASAFAQNPQTLFGSALDKVSREVVEQMRKDIATAIADGMRVDQLARKWTNIKGAPRIAEYRAAGAARTAIMEASNNAALAVYRDSGIVEAAQWNATFDTRTCMRCASLHGRIFRLDQSPGMPNHISCRCTWVPVTVKGGRFVKGEYRLPTKAAHDRASKKFDAYLRKQGARHQRDFFPSEKKYKLWKSRQKTIAEMVNGLGGSILPDSMLP